MVRECWTILGFNAPRLKRDDLTGGGFLPMGAANDGRAELEYLRLKRVSVIGHMPFIPDGETTGINRLRTSNIEVKKMKFLCRLGGFGFCLRVVRPDFGGFEGGDG